MSILFQPNKWLSHTEAVTSKTWWPSASGWWFIKLFVLCADFPSCLYCHLVMWGNYTNGWNKQQALKCHARCMIWTSYCERQQRKYHTSRPQLEHVVKYCIWIIICWITLYFISLWISLTLCWHPRPSLQRLPVRFLVIYFSMQQNHIICPSIGDHCHQTSSHPITLLNSTHSLPSCCSYSRPLPPSSHSSSNPRWIHSVSAVRLPQRPLTIPTSSVSISLIYCRAESLVWIDL